MCLSTPGHTLNTVVQVQKDPPVKLLLGTDAQAALGFALIQSDSDGATTDLLCPGQWRKEPKLDQTPVDAAVQDPSLAEVEPVVEAPQAEQETDPEVSPAVVAPRQTASGEAPDSRTIPKTHSVRLLQATKVPPRYKKVVRAKVNGVNGIPVSLFEPERAQVEDIGVVMEEAIVGCLHGSVISLVVENHGCKSIHLKKNTVIGSLEPLVSVLTSVEELSSEEGDGEEDTPRVDVSETKNRDRKQKLLDALKLAEAPLDAAQQLRLENLLERNADVFALDSSELGTTDLVTHSIETGDHVPTRQPLRRMPFSLRGKANEMVQEMLDQHIIEPSKSPWASPVVLVRKKDGSLRFCIDYRRLYSVTKQDVFPLPRIDDTLDLLAENRYFTTLDLASGYWQVHMHPESREKNAFQPLQDCMTFGLCSCHISEAHGGGVDGFDS